MTDINDLQAEEIASLENDEEILDLESLILDGEAAHVPIIIEYPKGDRKVKAAAMIKPVTSAEFTNSARLSMGKNKVMTNMSLELCKRGLLTKNGDKFPVEAIEKLPAGVVENIAKKIADISGVSQDEEEIKKMFKELVGF